MNFIYRCEECGTECPCILTILEKSIVPKENEPEGCIFVPQRNEAKWNMLTGMTII